MGIGEKEETRIFDSRLVAYLAGMHPETRMQTYLSALAEAHELRTQRIPGKTLKHRVVRARDAYNQAARRHAVMAKVPILGTIFALSLETRTHEYFHLVYVYEVREKFGTADEIEAEQKRVQLEYIGLRRPTHRRTQKYGIFQPA